MGGQDLMLDNAQGQYSGLGNMKGQYSLWGGGWAVSKGSIHSYIDRGGIRY
jgi:uncharacterized protein YbdZ (MbtH family)